MKVNINKAQKALREKFKKASRSQKLLEDIGETVVKNAVGEVRLGKDPATGKPIAPFKNARDYAARRSQIAKRAGRGTSFKPAKSNLTLSGQLLKAVRYTIKKGQVILEVADTSRKPYGNEKKTPSNRKLAQFQKDAPTSRNIIGVSEKTRETVANKVRAFLRRNLLNK